MFKSFYSRFLEADPSRLHFAAHSHHLWPDVTREAQIRYWDDAAKYADEKWNHIFGKMIPETQTAIAEVLHLSDPGQICFAPNTHEFIARLISSFDQTKPLSILTTDGEFHSFRRQMERLKELPNVTVTQIPVEPFESFERRFHKAAEERCYELIFSSHVFFALGLVVQDLTSFVKGCGEGHGAIVIDGYHGFCAIPTNLRSIETDIFYMAGGYKYAQSGEGVCFMHVPKGCTLRPLNTGWFAAYGALQDLPKGSAHLVQYSDDAFRFWGATFDPSGIYRMHAALKLLNQHSLSTAAIHHYIQSLQQKFLSSLEERKHGSINKQNLIVHDLGHHAHFFTFRTPDAHSLYKEMLLARVITDVRGDCLRFGFGLYQDETDINELFKRL